MPFPKLFAAPYAAAGLAKAKIASQWAGYVDSTPDGVPAIAEVSSLPGLVLVAGLSGHGFGIGPNTAHLRLISSRAGHFL